MATEAQIRLIQIARKQLGIPDVEYYTLLNDQFNVTSSTELSSRQVSALISLFKKRGFKPKTTPRKKPAEGVIKLASPAQRDLIDRLKANILWEHEDGYQRWLNTRMHLNIVKTTQEASRVIEGLKRMANATADTIQERGLVFPIALDELFTDPETGEIYPSLQLRDITTSRVITLINKDY